MAFNDNDELDLSYMDENTSEATAQPSHKIEPEDMVDFYDDDFDVSANTEQNTGDASNHGEAPNERHDQTNVPSEDQSMNPGQASVQDTSNPKKRKDRDDDDGYSQAQSHSVLQTPQPASSTPMQQAMNSGQIASQALDIKQLPHEINEETIREWANVVNAEGDIVELKFDEFKPNGKSKGACYVKFSSSASAQALKEHITSLPPLPGKPAFTAYYCTQNPYLRSSGGKDNYSNYSGGGVSGGGHTRGQHQGRGSYGQGFRGGGFQNRGNFNNAGGYGTRGGYGQGQGFQQRGGFQQGGYAAQSTGGFQQNQNVGAGMGFNNGMMGQNSFNRGGGMNRGVVRGGMGFNSGMNRGGAMGVTPAIGMGQVPVMAGRGQMPNYTAFNGMMPNMMMMNGMNGMMGGAGAMGRGGVMNPMQNMIGGGGMGQTMGRGGFQQGGAQNGQQGMGGGPMGKKMRYN